MSSVHSVDRDVFLSGLVVNLCAPDVMRDIDNDSWHSWFNNLSITKHLVHGVYPNTRIKQLELIEKMLADPSVLVLTVVDQDTDRLCGVISLKNIDFRLRKAEIGMVTSTAPPGGALEAMSLLVSHGFDRLNLEKIYCSQHEGLWKWINTLRTIGFRIEGLQQEQVFINNVLTDIVLTGIRRSDYLKLIGDRGGSLINVHPHIIAQKRSRRNFVPSLRSLLIELNSSDLP